MLASLMVVGALAVVLAAGAVLLALQNSRLKTQLEEARNVWLSLRDTPRQLDVAAREANDARHQLVGAHQEVASMREEAASVRAELSATRTLLEKVQAADKQKEGWLEHQESEIEWCKEELTKRPKIVRRSYKILTLGVSGTGKTALTLKWANPLVDLGTLRGTKVERYERTVSHIQDGDELVEHVFEVRDWGGEHIVDAQQELIVDEIHGLLIVVDLTTRDGTTVEPARVQEQLREFQPESLKFFFGPKTMAACQAVVLFINKSDVLSGTPAEIEREARRHYQRLIDDLQRYESQLDVHVLVGSATYGHSTHHLFAHFVGRILPESAYDQQLLQRMKADSPTDAGTQPMTPVPGERGSIARDASPSPVALPPPPLPVLRASPPALPPMAIASAHRAGPGPVAPRLVRPGMVVAASTGSPPPASPSALSTTTETIPHVTRR